MRVLVACEFSGVVGKAFQDRGHSVLTCDLLPTENPEVPHYQGNIRHHVLGREWQYWDLLIGHPPCQYLTNAGARWLYKGGKGTDPDPMRWHHMKQARAFFMMLYDLPIPHICLENPIPHKHAQLPAYSQIIQPWQFGHGETKATCLWLKGLPELKPTNVVSGRTPRVHHASPGPDRWKERSRTLTGIAAAMADQWG